MIDYIFNIITLVALLVVLFFQIRNFAKYSEGNGANYTRITMMWMIILFIIHTIRLLFGVTQGVFYMLAVLTFLVLYEIIDIKKIFKK